MKHLGKWSATMAGLVAMSMALTACGGAAKPAAPAVSSTAKASDGKPVDGGTLTWGQTSDIVTLNPLFIDDVPSQDVSNEVLAGLYDTDSKANLVADANAIAAELPQVSADGKTYTIKLKDTPKWTDGQPVTADDVVWTFKTYANKEVGSPQSSAFDKVQDIKAVDAHTVQITLKQVYAPFALTALTMAPLPSHVLKDVAAKDLQKNAFGTDPAKTVTDGPWKWTSWTQKQNIQLDADPNYWGPKPHIKTINFKIFADQNTEVQAFVKGDVDLVEQIPVPALAAVQGKQGINLVEQAGPVYDYIGFNFKGENFPSGVSPFTGVKTRQAIAYALNRQGMVDSILKGHGKLLNSPFLPGTWADKGTAVNYTFDVNKAKDLLKQDGWTAGPDGILQKDGHKFEFELQYNAGNTRRESLASVIQQELKDVGIAVTPKALDFSSWIKNNITPGKFQACLLGWQLSLDPDAESIFSSKYFPDNSGQNAGWYVNKEADQLWVDGYSTTDQAKRAEVYGKLAQTISTDLPYIFLYQMNFISGYQSRVHFADADKPALAVPYGYAYHIQNWWVDAK